MVISHIIGGLGNQMFQYAVGFRLSKKLGAEYKIDTSDFTTYPLHHYGLNELSISATVANQKEVRRFVRKRSKVSTLLWGLCHNPDSIVRRPGYMQEQEFVFNQNILEMQEDQIYLHGYWQSEKYFNDVAPEIRHEFTTKANPEGENAAMLAKIVHTNAVCVHIRRGDYVKNKHTNDFHGTVSREYYYNAVEALRAKVRDIQLYIFSDDLDWVKENLNFDLPTTYVGHNGPEKDYEDLRLMSSCKHHIIANSTFSWWGAWLGQSEGQIVIAPKKWFRAEVPTDDLIPTRWVRM